MRFLPALLLIAAPLLAQEPSEEERKVAEDARASEKRAEEIRRVERDREERAKLNRLLDELRSKSETTREKAIEALKQADLNIDELLPLIADALERAESARNALGAFQLAGPAARTLYLGTEAISGSADGTDYTLKSLGDGTYELNATKSDEDGRVMERWADKGTLKELQEKHAFLRSALVLQVPNAYAVRALRGRIAPEAAPQYAAGLAVARTFFDGGGRVGVNVTPPPEELRFHLQLPEGAGFIVHEVVPGSRAEEIGIRRMDILLKLDGELIDSPIQLKKLHEKKGVLEIIRRAETKKIDLATIEKPAETPPEEPAQPREAR